MDARIPFAKTFDITQFMIHHPLHPGEQAER